ncbi:MAG: DUF4340 domain-containing protein [Prosthecobacter sp.]|jgi:hypothetical protein|uniref:DUF4340 domain-containing protein n=1 Tax=Prosthecobacter sp. TaxID=1965333 RepID=UPI0019F9BCBB|nr:DUF4340 domain-containing protein [Prosthecobacter sp.]MBE2282513.1 DUF4340 domain-containing protein [Prosthecobacter sp.]
MNIRTTLFLFLLVAALGAMILGIERYFPSAKELREIKRGPDDFAKERVTRIEVASGDNTPLTLVRDGNAWQIESPLSDQADPQKVAALILAMGNVEWIERIHRDEFDDSEWQKTGLDRPSHKVRLSAGDELLYECWFGAPAVIENSVYIGIPNSKEGGTAWYLAKSSAPVILQIPAASWRDPKLLRLPAEVITGITLTQASGQIVITRENEHAPWMLEKPLKTRGSKERITELLSTLLNIEIAEARDPAASANGGTSKEALAPAVAVDELKVTIESKTRGKSYEFTLKKPADDKQAVTAATAAYRKPAFTVAAKNLSSLWVTPNALRDHLLAQIDGERLQFITITSKTHPEINLRNQGGSWYLLRHGKWDPANGDRISRCLNALNTHEILQFTADTAADLTPFGLDDPFQTVTWTPAREKPVKLMFGHNAESTQFFAKYENEPFIYRIDASLLPSIPTDGIKWKGLGALRFTTFALRRISIAFGANSPVVLDYNPVTAQWKAQRGGRDVTEEIDRVKADQLASNLARFTVQDWAADRTDALQALKTPFLTIQIVLGEAGRTDGPVREVEILFAPTQPNAETAFYYGQIKGDPDVFYMTRVALLQVVGDSVFKAKPTK